MSWLDDFSRPRFAVLSVMVAIGAFAGALGAIALADALTR